MSLRANTEAVLRLDATFALLRGAGEHVSLTLQNAQCDRAECAAPGPNAPTRGNLGTAFLVRVPGRPEAIRAFTAAETLEAEGYAAAAGGSIENLPD